MALDTAPADPSLGTAQLYLLDLSARHLLNRPNPENQRRRL